MQNFTKYFRLASVILVCAYFWSCAATYADWHFIDNVDLIFHEAGHAIFFFLGRFMNILAGSAFQVALPVAIAIYFFLSRRKISGALCLLWVGQNLLNVSVYAGDAIKMQIDLLGGDSVIHDWNYLLDALGILKYAPAVASIFHIAGIAILSAGTVLAIYYSLGLDGENGVDENASRLV